VNHVRRTELRDAKRFSRAECLLRQLFEHIHIANEVHREVVMRGAGRAAARTVADAAWIKDPSPTSVDEMRRLRTAHPLGDGDLAPE